MTIQSIIHTNYDGSTTDYVIITNQDGSFTSMTKETYDAQQAALASLETPTV
jgi:hypothetical protein